MCFHPWISIFGTKKILVSLRVTVRNFVKKLLYQISLSDPNFISIIVCVHIENWQMIQKTDIIMWPTFSYLTLFDATLSSNILISSYFAYINGVESKKFNGNSSGSFWITPFLNQKKCNIYKSIYWISKSFGELMI